MTETAARFKETLLFGVIPEDIRSWRINTSKDKASVGCSKFKLTLKSAF